MAEANRKVAFIGLGVMGFPMAGHLATAGHEVTVFNRTASKAEKWTATHKGRMADTPARAAEGAELVFACVGKDDDVREVSLGGDGAFAGMGEGAIFVDHTTASAGLARELAKEAEGRGIGFLDAPVSGGQAGAENGVLTIMVGGRQGTFERAKDAMSCYGRTVTLMGAPGAGQLTKMANQTCIAGLIQGLAEGLNFAMRAGLDAHQVIEVISKGAAQSWEMDNRGDTMIDGKFDFGFAVDWMRKDLGICLEEARRNGARLPVTAMVDEFYAKVQELGGGRWDNTSLIHLLAQE